MFAQSSFYHGGEGGTVGEQEGGGDIWYPRAKYGHEAFAHDHNWGGQKLLAWEEEEGEEH